MSVRVATKADVPAIAAVLSEPEVARWWGRTDEDDVLRTVGIMREYERDHDGGGWHDGLLMDLLARERG